MTKPGMTAVLLIGAGMLTLPSAGAAADLSASIKTQLKTAAYHAGELAYRSVVRPRMGQPTAHDRQLGGAIVMTRLHLQHTINCLAGPSGVNFRPDVNSCEGQGNGVIPDLRVAVTRGVPGAEAALEDTMIAWNLVIKARQMTDVDEAQPWANVIARYLQKAASELGG